MFSIELQTSRYACKCEADLDMPVHEFNTLDEVIQHFRKCHSSYIKRPKSVKFEIFSFGKWNVENFEIRSPAKPKSALITKISFHSFQKIFFFIHPALAQQLLDANHAE